MTESKRLAILLPSMTGGGAERVAVELARDWVRRGHQVDVVLLSAEGALLGLLPAEVRIVNLAAARIRSALRPLIAYLRSARPDAIQISMWPLTVLGIIAHRLARSRARLVVSEHVTLSKQYADLGRAGGQYLRRSIAAFYPLADARVAVSSGAAEDLAMLSRIEPSSITVIHNPVQQFDLNNRLDVSAPWAGAKARILTVGSLKAQKNHRLLIQAMAKLPKAIGAKLMILGEGPLRAELDAEVQRLNLGSDVIFQAFDLDPGPYYRSADLFVLSSDYEGFALVIVEALNSGLPVVSTDCASGPSEILGDGEFGTLVPCGDAEGLAKAIADALRTPPDSDRLIARGRLFSGEDSSQRYLDLMIG